MLLGGHVESGEFGLQTIIRECKEELGIDVTEKEVRYLVSSTSVYEKDDFHNKHYDECYLIVKDIDISKLQLQIGSIRSKIFF